MILKLTPRIDHPANDGHAHLAYYDRDLQVSVVFDGRTPGVCFGGYGEAVTYTVLPVKSTRYPMNPQGDLSAKITMAQFNAFGAAVCAHISSNAEALAVALEASVDSLAKPAERATVRQAIDCLRYYLKEAA